MKGRNKYSVHNFVLDIKKQQFSFDGRVILSGADNIIKFVLDLDLCGSSFISRFNLTEEQCEDVSQLLTKAIIEDGALLEYDENESED